MSRTEIEAKLEVLRVCIERLLVPLLTGIEFILSMDNLPSP